MRVRFPSRLCRRQVVGPIDPGRDGEAHVLIREPSLTVQKRFSAAIEERFHCGVVRTRA
jgi:hypothetical protein